MKSRFWLLLVLSALFIFYTSHLHALKLPLLLSEVEAIYKKSGTLTAEFSQEKFVASLKMKKNSSGVLWVKRPKSFRWQTHEPDPNILVSNGTKTWFYTPPFDETEPGQVIVRKSSEVQSQLLNALLMGAFSSYNKMKIRTLSSEEYLLTPQAGTAADIQKIRIKIDPKKKHITQVHLTHKGGNTSQITLSKITLGGKLTEDLFIFTPPANTIEQITK